MRIWTILVFLHPHFSLVTELFLQMNSYLKDKIIVRQVQWSSGKGGGMSDKRRLVCPLPPIQSIGAAGMAVLVTFALIFYEICTQRPSALSSMFLTLSLTYPGHTLFLCWISSFSTQLPTSCSTISQKYLRQRPPSHCLSSDFQIKSPRASMILVFSQFAEL